MKYLRLHVSHRLLFLLLCLPAWKKVCNHPLKWFLPGLVTATCLPGIKISEAIRKVKEDKEEQSHSLQPHKGEAASVFLASVWSQDQTGEQEGGKGREGRPRDSVLTRGKYDPVMDGRKQRAALEMHHTCLPAGVDRHDFLCLYVEVAGNEECPWRSVWAKWFADRAECTGHSIVPTHTQPQHQPISQRENNICLHLPGEALLWSRLTEALATGFPPWALLSHPARASPIQSHLCLESWMQLRNHHSAQALSQYFEELHLCLWCTNLLVCIFL